MCGDICPVGAIRFIVDNQGFWYPDVDEDKCIGCGLCEKRCPMKGEIVCPQTDNPIAYEAWSMDDDIRLSSTSGGIFWEFAKQIVSCGGVVAGCVYGDDWKSAKHILASTLEELERIKGSKYFQSDTLGIYKSIKNELDSGKMVLFSGTPCQNVALYNFLGKEYEKLFYLEFICRSINSPLAFSKFVEELEIHQKAKVDFVQLKNKDNGWQSLATKIHFDNGNYYYADKNSDLWVKGFICNDLYTRESCENCRYKSIPRHVADITIGDFWGIKGLSPDEMNKGVSVLMVNSKRGRELLNLVRGSVHIKERSIDEVIAGNPALVKNVNVSSHRELFWKNINKGCFFSDAVKASIKITPGEKVRMMMNRIEKVINILLLGDVSLVKFIRYNYFCKNIERHNGKKVLPHYGTVINFAKGSKIVLDGNNLEIGYNKLKGSRSETHIRMDENSRWECMGGGLLFYGTVLEVKKEALFRSGFFSANSGSVIIADKSITFGEDVMIGRNVLIYDSDFHQIRNEKDEMINPPEPVVIGDHVWLTSNITVLKGVTIGNGSLIASQTVINKDAPENSVIAAQSVGTVIKDNVHWNRERCRKI